MGLRHHDWYHKKHSQICWETKHLNSFIFLQGYWAEVNRSIYAYFSFAIPLLKIIWKGLSVDQF